MIKIPQGRFIVEEYDPDQWCVSFIDSAFEGRSSRMWDDSPREIVVCGENRNQCVELAVMLNSIIGAA